MCDGLMAAEPGVANEDILQVSGYEHDGIPVVLAQGDVDLCTTPVLRHALETACVNRPEPGTVAVDMREVPFIDSAGLALLVEIRKRFMEKCRLALIIERGSQPERVLRLGRFDTFLQVCYAPEELTAAPLAVAA
jgi:anti-anti-sigma factor